MEPFNLKSAFIDRRVTLANGNVFSVGDKIRWKGETKHGVSRLELGDEATISNIDFEEANLRNPFYVSFCFRFLEPSKNPRFVNSVSWHGNLLDWENLKEESPGASASQTPSPTPSLQPKPTTSVLASPLHKFQNQIRSLFNIEAHDMPDLQEIDLMAFLLNPVKFFLFCDDATAEIIFAAVQKRQRN